METIHIIKEHLSFKTTNKWTRYGDKYIFAYGHLFNKRPSTHTQQMDLDTNMYVSRSMDLDMNI